MKLIKQHKIIHNPTENIDILLLWKTFLGIKYARQMRIYRDGIWII